MIPGADPLLIQEVTQNGFIGSHFIGCFAVDRRKQCTHNDTGRIGHGSENPVCQLILQRQRLVTAEFAIKGLGPNLRAVPCIHQLSCDPGNFPGAAYQGS